MARDAIGREGGNLDYYQSGDARGRAVAELMFLAQYRRDLVEARREVLGALYPADAEAIDVDLQQANAAIHAAALELAASRPAPEPGDLPAIGPDVGGFLQAIFAPVVDGGLGKERARELARAYPEFTIAMDRGDYATARAAADEALADAVITQGEFDTLQSLFTAFHIPDPAT